MFKRIGLFIITNLAIIAILSLVLHLLGVGQILDEQGVGLDMANLIVFAAVFGFGGSFISLVISKWTAKRLTGARVIETPSNETEAWLIQVVRRQAEVAGIGMPEVAIYDAPDVNAFATGMRRNNAEHQLGDNRSNDKSRAVPLLGLEDYSVDNVSDNTGGNNNKGVNHPLD